MGAKSIVLELSSDLPHLTAQGRVYRRPRSTNPDAVVRSVRARVNLGAAMELAPGSYDFHFGVAYASGKFELSVSGEGAASPQADEFDTSGGVMAGLVYRFKVSAPAGGGS